MLIPKRITLSKMFLVFTLTAVVAAIISHIIENQHKIEGLIISMPELSIEPVLVLAYVMGMHGAVVVGLFGVAVWLSIRFFIT